jgi:hypothetical protein
LWMKDPAIVIGGIPLPSDSPAFLLPLGVHIAAGLICVAAGLVAMLSSKRAGQHPAAGTVYYWSLSAVFITAAMLSAMFWAEDYHLFILGFLSFVSASAGRMARRRARILLHIAGMGASYILLLTAFYVDNGKNLPLWRELPQIAFWILPGLIGVPLIARALRHRSQEGMP